MIQIKNVPDPVHRTLKARAAQAGMTLSDYLLKEISSVAERPTLEELLARLKARGPIDSRFDSAAAVRAERESRR
ncbi:MAG: FitA-like ribbon-helix-helix domain-containing protein [Myxococcaceae bacterium]